MNLLIIAQTINNTIPIITEAIENVMNLLVRSFIRVVYAVKICGCLIVKALK